MNTAKQVNVMLGLFMVMLIGTFLYFLWDSSRAEEATERQLHINAERGAELYTLNCRSCHGLTGQGPLERTALPGAVLNAEDPFRPDSAGMLAAIQQRVRNTIECGRIGTLMPPWLQEHGGALNFFQIRQLVTMITGAGPTEEQDPPPDPNAVSLEAWEFVYEEANHADAFSPHKFLAEAVDAEQTTLPVENTDGILAESVLRLGGNAEEPQYELVLVEEVNEDEIVVERGVEGSMATEHEEHTEIFGGFVPPGTTITGEETFVCGQMARGGGGGEETVQISDGDTIALMDDFFDIDGAQNPILEVIAGESLTLSLPNEGANTHNMRIDGGDGTYGDLGGDPGDDFISDPDAIAMGEEGTIDFSFDETGTFQYRCDFHPITMLGEIEVVEAE